MNIRSNTLFIRGGNMYAKNLNRMKSTPDSFNPGFTSTSSFVASDKNHQSCLTKEELNAELERLIIEYRQLKNNSKEATKIFEKILRLLRPEIRKIVRSKNKFYNMPGHFDDFMQEAFILVLKRIEPGGYDTNEKDFIAYLKKAIKRNMCNYSLYMEKVVSAHTGFKRVLLVKNELERQGIDPTPTLITQILNNRSPKKITQETVTAILDFYERRNASIHLTNDNDPNCKVDLGRELIEPGDNPIETIFKSYVSKRFEEILKEIASKSAEAREAVKIFVRHEFEEVPISVLAAEHGVLRQSTNLRVNRVRGKLRASEAVQELAKRHEYQGLKNHISKMEIQ